MLIMTTRPHHNGFTIVELLVVIAIIGLLAAVVLASLNAARGRSRDVARLTQMREVEKALNLYYLNHGTYPDWISGNSTRANSCFTNGNSSDGMAQWGAALGVLVTEGYLPSLPGDPQNIGASGAGTDYCLGYHRSLRGSGNNTYQLVNGSWQQITDNAVNERCRNKDTNEYYLPKDYQYLLYFSVEDSNSHNITLDWNGATENNKPFNGCIVGPRR
jgi:prepilin-type N-terminal cleavage/methylation domain-containing protein